MAVMPKPIILSWTHHAQAKMYFYKLSPARVRRVLNSPKRVEEGVAPKTVAMMQPAAIKAFAGRAGAKKEERWTQEIWVMIQDAKRERKVISAWRYPGVTKPRSAAAVDAMRREYDEFLSKGGR
ncbi:MAG: hypothetical protein ABSC29_02710 [Minisyncoccia bacterium]|jgi:hypothetical protein